MNGKDQRTLFEQQLFEAKSELFAASNVRQVRFLQNKIKYLEDQLNGFESDK